MSANKKRPSNSTKELDGRKKSRLISLAYAVERPHHILGSVKEFSQNGLQALA